MKCVILLDRALSPGFAANAAAVLALTLGKRVEGIIGHDLPDRDGRQHTGITTTPIPILTADMATLRTIRERLFAEGAPDMLVVDFTDAARSTRTYADYAARLADQGADSLVYLALAMAGPAKTVTRLTGHLPLYR